MTTKEYPNFYENVKEANLRLRHSVVVYDGDPYYVWCISDHMSDGIFRVYMEKLGNIDGHANSRIGGMPYDYGDETILGNHMDKWMELNEKHNHGIIRKHMNSPKFNRFRPFPLGMCNSNGRVAFLERAPQRHTQQGLTEQHLQPHWVTLETGSGSKTITRGFSIWNTDLLPCIKGDYPTFQECIVNLADETVTNQSVAFDRNFALVRGPLGALYLAYKTDIIGLLPSGDASEIRLAKAFSHVREVLELTQVFKQVIVK